MIRNRSMAIKGIQLAKSPLVLFDWLYYAHDWWQFEPLRFNHKPSIDYPYFYSEASK